VTRDLIRAGQLIKIEVLDHVILVGPPWIVRRISPHYASWIFLFLTNSNSRPKTHFRAAFLFTPGLLACIRQEIDLGARVAESIWRIIFNGVINPLTSSSREDEYISDFVDDAKNANALRPDMYVAEQQRLPIDIHANAQWRLSTLEVKSFSSLASMFGPVL